MEIVNRPDADNQRNERDKRDKRDTENMGKMLDILSNNNKTERNNIPLLSTAALAGSLSGYSDAVTAQECERISSPIAGAEMAIPIVGESMAPELPNGSRIHIKKLKDASFIEWGRIYVLDTDNGAVVKILMPSEDAQSLRCLSINPQPQYAPFDVPKSSIYAIYRVVGSFNHL